MNWGFLRYGLIFFTTVAVDSCLQGTVTLWSKTVGRACNGNICVTVFVLFFAPAAADNVEVVLGHANPRLSWCQLKGSLSDLRTTSARGSRTHYRTIDSLYRLFMTAWRATIPSSYHCHPPLFLAAQNEIVRVVGYQDNRDLGEGYRPRLYSSWRFGQGKAAREHRAHWLGWERALTYIITFLTVVTSIETREKGEDLETYNRGLAGLLVRQSWIRRWHRRGSMSWEMASAGNRMPTIITPRMLLVMVSWSLSRGTLCMYISLC